MIKSMKIFNELEGGVGGYKDGGVAQVEIAEFNNVSSIKIGKVEIVQNSDGSIFIGIPGAPYHLGCDVLHLMKKGDSVQIALT